MLTGTLTADSVEIIIPEQLPSSIATINVTWANSPFIPPAPPQKRRNIPLTYDIDVNIPRAHVNSKQLSSTWKGKFRIKGDPDNPELYGECKLAKGQYNFRGKPFTLTQGLISFNGAVGKKSTLHLIASQQVDTTKIDVILKGPLRDPVVVFRSNPPSPRREIISRLLFGKGSGEISPLEDTQLSQSLSSLSSQQSSNGLLDRMRNALPFDRIDIDFNSKASQGSDSLSVGVGKYISEGILISVKRDIARENTGGVSQSNEGDRSRLGIEADLMRHLKLEAEIDDRSNTELILKWQRDY